MKNIKHDVRDRRLAAAEKHDGEEPKIHHDVRVAVYDPCQNLVFSQVWLMVHDDFWHP